ncbi:M81 family metallopeptidase [Virgibacillus halophilus]|uniref:M81 family metallopeptidase n=1 Tax=Tigheibacillus halophilus TaxID=361280 RepID=A0ABU5C2Y3_9BACI|nr:M81 family metallopeptidase [Virgibacillus halophilus]
MKVLVGHFNSESNEFSYQNMGFDNFVFRYGIDSIDVMQVRDIFEEKEIELIPSIYANGHPGGLVTKDAFDFILHRMLTAVKENLAEIDGIYLYLHGASKVVDLEGGSAEHMILSEIRRITGPYLPIAVTMDPHGNLSQNLADNATIIRTYRHSPHTDAVETRRIVAGMLVDLLQNRRSITPVYRKVPIMIGGERAVSTDEPMVSINKYLDEVESDPRILSASFHIGYLEHDGDKLGCSVIVVPDNDTHAGYANEMADKIYDFVLARRYQFHYHGIVDFPENALKRAIEYDGKPVFITDSGDNCGAGGDGYSNFILRQLMELKDYNQKNILVAGIIDKHSYAHLYDKKSRGTSRFRPGYGVGSSM